MSEFDYRTATEAEILERADLLEGLRLGDIPGATFTSTDPRRGRQEVGWAVEAWFGIPPNPIQGPDFPGAGIELKTIPLVRAVRRQLRVKERTVISLIDFKQLVDESWDTASVRKKLKILFVFFEHLEARPKSEFPIHSVLLWRPEGDVEEQIRLDWEAVWTKVGAGLAHELTEADGRVLGPCTKGVDSRSRRRQPFSDELAKPRAFALKPSFTLALYLEPRVAPLEERDIAESASLDAFRDAFRRFIGRTIGDVAQELAIGASSAKNYAARVARKAVENASPVSTPEFRRIGPTVRAPRVGADWYPYEAISFPAFKHSELTEEQWEDSALLSYIEHMLFIPVRGGTRTTSPDRCTIGSPIFWQPTADQLGVVAKEWMMFRDLIASGKSSDLPTESRTRAIHVRPHARDATDREAVPGGGSQIKKSFWLNKRLIQEILTSGSS